MKELLFIINHLTTLHSDYAIHRGHPIDLRNRKYKVWRKILQDQGFLRCHMCKSEVTEIRLVKCKGAGSIYKPDGRTKYNFKLFGDRNIEMTIDHWIPKSFLRRNGLNWNMMSNLVLMCENCNKYKSNIIPANWKDLYERMTGEPVLPKNVAYC